MPERSYSKPRSLSALLADLPGDNPLSRSWRAALERALPSGPTKIQEAFRQLGSPGPQTAPHANAPVALVPRPAFAVSDPEDQAIVWLGTWLRSNPKATRGAAWAQSRKDFPTLSAIGFKTRVWPAGRRLAGLQRFGSPGRQKGRKNKNNRSPI